MIIPIIRFPIILFFLCTLFWSCQSAPMASREENPSLLAYAVVDAQKGQTLAQKDALKALPIASLAKLFVADYGLTVLGSLYRFHTRVYQSGGSLYLVGGGDPSLNLRDLIEITEKLSAKSISASNLYYDDSFIPEVSSLSDEIHPVASYNAGVSALNVEFNQAFYQWEPSATFLPSLPLFQPLSPEREKLMKEFGQKFLRIPVNQPSQYAAELFAELLRSRKKSLLKTPPTRKNLPSSAILLVDHTSKPLEMLVNEMLEYSNNLYAEAIGLVTSRKLQGQAVSLQKSVELLQKWIASRYGIRSLKLVNHSGLSPSSQTSAQDIVLFLQKMVSKPFFQSRLNPYGWQWRNNSPIQYPHFLLTLASKSGSLDFVSNRAGTLFTRTGKKLVFAILSSDLTQRQKTRSLPFNELKIQNQRWSEEISKQQESLLNEWYEGHFNP